MENPDIPSDKKQFLCTHCSGKVLVPRNLPPTTAPCPYCGGMITSPGEPVAPAPPVAPPPVPPPAVIASLVHGTPPPAAETPVQTPPRSSAPVAPARPAPQPAPQTSAEPAAKVQQPEPALPAPQAAAKQPATSKPHVPAKSGGFPIALVSMLLLGGGALTYFVTKEMNREIPPPKVAPAGTLTALDANYIRIGWQKDANRLLRDFLAAKKAGDKLPFILNAETLAPRVRNFYGNGTIDDSDTPAGAFSVYELSEDNKRGLFMMTYDQPPQFDMREFFRPLATMEVQYGIDEADILLSTVARAGNFAMEPLRVHAFFKKTPEGLKLDWEIFAQTKYRTFRNFIELPEPGHSGVFRVFVVEDVPDSKAGPGIRTYRLSDPAHTDDAARVNVKEESEIGRHLSQLNWLGTKDGNPLTRTATVELAWIANGGTPQLELRRFICWEFLGLGGEEKKATVSAK